MKVFISQPMSGLSNEEIRRVRKKAQDDCCKMFNIDNVEVLDTWYEDFEEMYTNHFWCLGEAIKKLAYADLVWFVQGWEDSHGCCVEMACVKEYNLPYVNCDNYDWRKHNES